MAVYNSSATKFQKVSGWTDGPLKPTTTTATGTAANIQSAVASAVSGIGSMAVGESVHIIVTIAPDPE
ncbi:MAG: hypothetical protein IIZ78_11885 [Clostridiales bacterium]|nr:hypothetical protein [Clostridiales bacterium]